ncbi:HEAT repeat domain-containing protein [bacterium]|nr:HEAT repeat domain-containing protein [bacterium]
MRGVTLAVIAAGAAVLLAIAVLMRGGDEGTSSGTDAGVAARPRAGTGSAGANADAKSGNSRVEDRLNQLRADYDKRQADAPGASRREAPTASAKADKMRERAEQDLAVDDSDDDPEELAEARDTLQNNQDPDERIGAILMLTGDEGPESMRLLMESMDDPDPEVRLAAVEALGDRVEELTPGLLAKPLRDPDAEVRFEAISVLGDMEDPEALALVKEALHDPDEDNRNLAAGILDFADDDTDTTAKNAAAQPTAARP